MRRAPNKHVYARHGAVCLTRPVPLLPEVPSGLAPVPGSGRPADGPPPSPDGLAETDEPTTDRWRSVDTLGWDWAVANQHHYPSVERPWELADDPLPPVAELDLGFVEWAGVPYPETDLQYHRARHYDPTPGLWLDDQGGVAAAPRTPRP